MTEIRAASIISLIAGVKNRPGKISPDSGKEVQSFKSKRLKKRV
ncbi:MAG: hypothetical protein ACAH10_09295 [Methylophilaceae bacterium]